MKSIEIACEDASQKRRRRRRRKRKESEDASQKKDYRGKVEEPK